MAVIFDIQRFSTHDGPGIRTVVFFKGCALRCAWCSNPEGQSFEPEVLFSDQRCVGCAACLNAAFGGSMMDRGNARVGVNRTRKPAPGLAKACPSLAIRVAGTEMTPREVAREVLRDAPFFSKSGGGVTFSGGEPLAHPAFVRELAQILLDRGASVAVETCLAVAPGALESVLGLPILWLADIKHVDAARFKEATGGNLSQVLANLTTLAARGARLELRIPLIPGFNADDASMEGILALAAGLPNLSGETRRIDFLPYHELALGKYAMLDRQMAWKGGHDVARHDVARWAARAAALGFTASTGG